MRNNTPPKRRADPRPAHAVQLSLQIKGRTHSRADPRADLRPAHRARFNAGIKERAEKRVELRAYLHLAFTV